MDKGFHTGMVLIDLQKAFDSLDRTLLLQKMDCIDFKESKKKKNCDIRCLFRCWMLNDLPQALNETGSYLYADDTCIFYQDKDVEKIEKVLNKEFPSLCEWFIDNKLLIHFGDDKTKTIFFSRKKRPAKTKDCQN